MDHIFLAISWIIFCLLHSLLASLRFKRKAEKLLGKKYSSYRLIYTLFAFMSFIAVMIFQISISSFFIFIPNLLTIIAGCLLALPGLVLMGLSIHKYFLRLTGLYWLLNNESEKILYRNGIHKYVRHPLYLGTFLFIWGLFIVVPYLSLLIANIIITTYTLIGIRMEELKLQIEFGDSYKQYQQEVPMIIPKS